MMDEMNLVFDKAKEKAISRIEKEGNTATPWKDFSDIELKERLFEEISEFETADMACDFNKSKDELLDIINLSNFLYLRLS